MLSLPSRCSSRVELYVFAKTHSLGKQTVLFGLCLQETGGIMAWEEGRGTLRWDGSQPLAMQGLGQNTMNHFCAQVKSALGDRTPVPADEWRR